MQEEEDDRLKSSFYDELFALSLAPLGLALLLATLGTVLDIRNRVARDDKLPRWRDFSSSTTW